MIKGKAGFPSKAEPGENYLYNVDFTDVADYILPLKPGDVIPPEFTMFLGSISGDVWSLTGTSEYSLDGAQIIYNGENSPEFRTCNWFKHVLIIQLSDKCRLLEGILAFHLYRKD